MDSKMVFELDGILYFGELNDDHIPKELKFEMEKPQGYILSNTNILSIL